MPDGTGGGLIAGGGVGLAWLLQQVFFGAGKRIKGVEEQIGKLSELPGLVESKVTELTSSLTSIVDEVKHAKDMAQKTFDLINNSIGKQANSFERHTDVLAQIVDLLRDMQKDIMYLKIDAEKG